MIGMVFIFGAVLRGIGGAVGGFLQGGPVGAVAGGVRGITRRPATVLRSPPLATQRRRQRPIFARGQVGAPQGRVERVGPFQFGPFRFGRERTRITPFAGPVTPAPAMPAPRFDPQVAGSICACPPQQGKPGKQCRCCKDDGGIGISNKSRYHRLVDRCADPDDPASYELVAPGTRCVSRRRMNPTNPQAAKRALRRLEGFDRINRRTQRALKKIAK